MGGRLVSSHASLRKRGDGEDDACLLPPLAGRGRGREGGGGAVSRSLIRERGLGELSLAELGHYFSRKPFQLFEADLL
jgi:hypothetical protein